MILKPVILAAWMGWALAVAAAPCAANPPNWGERKAVTFAALQQGFTNPVRIYAPFMFWFWDEPLHPVKMADARVEFLIGDRYYLEKMSIQSQC
jgi:hypothetical protein